MEALTSTQTSTSNDVTVKRTLVSEVPITYFRLTAKQVKEKLKIYASLASLVEDFSDVEYTMGKSLNKIGSQTVSLKADWLLSFTSVWDNIFKALTVLSGKQHSSLSSSLIQNISKVFPDCAKSSNKDLQLLIQQMDFNLDEIKRSKLSYKKSNDKYHRIISDIENNIKSRYTATDQEHHQISKNQQFMNVFTKQTPADLQKKLTDKCRDLIRELDVAETSLTYSSQQINSNQSNLCELLSFGLQKLCDIECRRGDVLKEGLARLYMAEELLVDRSKEIMIAATNDVTSINVDNEISKLLSSINTLCCKGSHMEASLSPELNELFFKARHLIDILEYFKQLIAKCSSLLLEVVDIERAYSKNICKTLEKHGYQYCNSTSGSGNQSASTQLLKSNTTTCAEVMSMLECPSMKVGWDASISMYDNIAAMHSKTADMIAGNVCQQLENLYKQIDSTKRMLYEKVTTQRKKIDIVKASASKLKQKLAKVQTSLKEVKLAIQTGKDYNGDAATTPTAASASSAADLDGYDSAIGNVITTEKETSKSESSKSMSKQLEKLGASIRTGKLSFGVAVGLETASERLVKLEQKVQTYEEEERGLTEALEQAKQNVATVHDTSKKDLSDGFLFTIDSLTSNLQASIAIWRSVTARMDGDIDASKESVTQLKRACDSIELEVDQSVFLQNVCILGDKLSSGDVELIEIAPIEIFEPLKHDGIDEEREILGETSLHESNAQYKMSYKKDEQASSRQNEDDLYDAMNDGGFTSEDITDSFSDLPIAASASFDNTLTATTTTTATSVVSSDDVATAATTTAATVIQFPTILSATSSPECVEDKDSSQKSNSSSSSITTTNADMKQQQQQAVSPSNASSKKTVVGNPVSPMNSSVGGNHNNYVTAKLTMSPSSKAHDDQSSTPVQNAAIVGELSKFGLNSNEKVLESYTCAIYPKKTFLIQGRMYITQRYIAFSGWPETRVLIAMEEVINVEKMNTLSIIPNAIQITTKSDDYFFASFIERDQCYQLIVSMSEVSKRLLEIHGSKAPGTSNSLNLGYQTAKHESLFSAMGMDMIDLDILGSNSQHNSNNSSTSSSTSSNNASSSSTSSSDSNTSTSNSNLQTTVIIAANSTATTNSIAVASIDVAASTSVSVASSVSLSSTPSNKSSSVNEPKILTSLLLPASTSTSIEAAAVDTIAFLSADTGSDFGTLFKEKGIIALHEQMVAQNVNSVWKYCWSESTSYADFLHMVGDLDVVREDWMKLDDRPNKVVEDVSLLPFTHYRKFKYAHPRTTMLMFGPKNAPANQIQYLYLVGNTATGSIRKGIVLTITQFDDIPMADCFKVLQYWSFAVGTSAGSNVEQTHIRIGAHVHFIKSTMFRGQVISGVSDELGILSKKWCLYADDRITCNRQSEVTVLSENVNLSSNSIDSPKGISVRRLSERRNSEKLSRDLLMVVSNSNSNLVATATREVPAAVTAILNPFESKSVQIICVVLLVIIICLWAVNRSQYSMITASVSKIDSMLKDMKTQSAAINDLLKTVKHLESTINMNAEAITSCKKL